MDFGFSPEQDTMRESVRRFMRERVAPRVAECEKLAAQLKELA